MNLVSKPMQVYNVDESGVNVVHKPCKIVAELGRHNVYSITAAERGKTHTIVACVSASGFVLPPMMVYPRKKSVPEDLKEGAVLNTLFTNSVNGLITKELYLEWFKHFLANIPPTRPVLLIQDGHSSHASIELIECARANYIHVLCLPAHTTHILQPLDVGVFKSFKAAFSKACRNYTLKHPGCITTDVIAALVGESMPVAFTPLNILSGFKKWGIQPLNPREVSDRSLAPSKAVSVQPSVSKCSVFTPEQEALYEKRYEEGYDLDTDPDYLAWLNTNYPSSALSKSLSVNLSTGNSSVPSL